MKPMGMIFALLLLVAPVVSAETVLPVEVTQLSLSTTRDESTRPYFLLTLPAVTVPEGFALGNAILEFLVDAEDVVTEGGAVVLEVYPFAGDANRALDVSNLGRTVMKRSVPVGENRRVRVYVTEFLERTIKNPNLSRQLLVGSMMGQRLGSFSAKTVAGASGEKAKLTVFFDRIEDTMTGQSGESNSQ